MLALAVVPNFWLSFAAIVASGFFAGLFGALQSAVVMQMVPDEFRGRALGMLTLAVGGAPFGAAALHVGEVAQAFGANETLPFWCLAGVVVQKLWLSPYMFPHALRIRRPD